MVGRLFIARLVVLLALCGASTAQAQAGQWWTTPQVLKDFFASADHVGYVDVDAAALKARGVPTTKAKHHVYVGSSAAGAVVGYAVVDEEVGQHEPISFAILLSPDLVVQRVEVMAYREAYGAEIRSPRYLKQWIGKRAADVDVKGAKGVDAVSGATLSSRSTVHVVRRALALAALAAASSPSSPAPSPSTPSPPTPSSAAPPASP